MRILAALLLGISLAGFSQDFKSIKYQFPINPGQQNYLAGTVGEIRSSHFHTGIDVKTGGRTGLPIYAVADGHISRIKVSAFGYGLALYMKHPNGTFSVYAHLESLDPKIAEWVLRQQYRKESYEVDLFPEDGQFAYKQGEIIGYSGNSGSSSGPHLHFEIRDANHQPIDVLSLGFDEIKDRLAPVVQKIAFVTLEEDARVNGAFGRHEFSLYRSNGFFTTNIPISLTGKIGIEIYSYDPMDGIPNKNGIVKTILTINDKTEFEEHKEIFNFSQQREVLVHYNYPAYKQGSQRFNRLYLADGNEHSMYRTVNRGLNFSNQKEINIETVDSYGNTSKTRIELSEETNPIAPKIYEYEQVGNFLHFKSKQQGSILMDQWTPIEHYLQVGQDFYYIWDLRRGIPTSLFIDGKTVPTDLVGMIPSGQKISYVQNELTLGMTSRTLFDTLYLGFKKEIDTIRDLELFHLKNPTQPIRSNITVSLNTEKEYDNERARVYSVFGNRFNYMGGTWNGSSIEFSTRDLVTYTILEDSIPPTIEARIINSNDLSFRINDKLSGIQSFRATINGEFVLMKYEPKRNLIWSKRLNENIPFKGMFTLEVIDNSNNKTIYTKTL